MNEFAEMDSEEAEGFMKFHYEQKVRNDIAKIVGNDSIIDMGCGKGIHIKDLYKPEQYIGYDCSKELLNIAKRENPNYNFKLGDLKNLNYIPDKTFDYAIIISVLEHTPSYEDAIQIMKEGKRIAKTLIIGWHMPPKYNQHKIIQLKADLKRLLYQNEYKLGSFDLPNMNIQKQKVDSAFEMWVITDG